MDKIILHSDLNNFYASVECVKNPELATKCVAVCGSAADRRGIVLAKNYAAKACGVQTGETVGQALAKCPGLVSVEPHFQHYAKYSRLVRQIYLEYSDLVEPFGMDENFIDVTASARLFGDGEKIAHEIRQRIKREVGLTVSVGVSFNKIFAKMGSDYKKPDAVTVIDRENFQKILSPMAAENLLFVGKQTAKALSACNIRTIGDLAAASPAFLTARFGKMGEMLSKYARGEDDAPVADIYESSDVKSVSNGMTFRRDLVTRDEIKLGLYVLSEDVARRLRKKGMKCSTVGVTVKDTLLKSFTRQIPVTPPTNLAKEIADAAYTLAKTAIPVGKPIRMLTVAAMHLIHEEDAVEQLGFFDNSVNEKREKRGKLENTVDELRAKFGRSAVTTGAVIGNDIGIKDNEKRE